MKQILFICISLLLGSILQFSLPAQASDRNNKPTDRAGLYKALFQMNNQINADLPEKPIYCDSIANKMIELAETSRDHEAICLAYHYLSHQYLNYGSIRNNLELADLYTKKYEEVSKNYNLDKYIIISQLRRAKLCRANNKYDKALEYNNIGLSNAIEYGNDSIISLCYSSIYNTWIQKDNYVAAFQSLLSAREFAEKSKSIERILLTMQDLGSFYFDLDEFEKSKDIFFEVESMGFESKEWESVLVAQRSIASNYIEQNQKALAMKFFEKAIHLADSIKMGGYKINIYFDILNFLLNKESTANALQFFNNKPEARSFLVNIGAEYEINKLMGLYYMEKRQFDSAGYFYNKYEPFIFENKDDNNLIYSLNAVRQYYHAIKDLPNERRILTYMQNFADSSLSLDAKEKTYSELDSFYSRMGNYEQALYYNKLTTLYKDSLESVTKKNELIQIELDNEAKRKLKKEAEASEALRQKYNLQYMGITIAIICVFILLALLGVFKASESLIKTMGFFAFIFLFEFIILILDYQIHHFTHGEPWKILAIKIVLIAMLLPFHHWLEHKVIHYLTTKDLIWKRKEKVLKADITV